MPRLFAWNIVCSKFENCCVFKVFKLSAVERVRACITTILHLPLGCDLGITLLLTTCHASYYQHVINLFNYDIGIIETILQGCVMNSMRLWTNCSHLGCVSFTFTCWTPKTLTIIKGILISISTLTMADFFIASFLSPRVISFHYWVIHPWIFFMSSWGL